MKKIYLFFCGLLIFFSTFFSQTEKFDIHLTTIKIDTPSVVKGKKDLFQAGRFFFSGQPDEEMFQWFSKNNVKLVVNLRTIKEMETIKKENFDEVDVINKLSMKYINIQMGGNAKYSPQMVDSLAQAIVENKGKILIHCRSAGRVSYLWAAYLIKYQGLTIDDAINIAKKIKYSFTLEKLLGYPLSVQKF